MGNPQENLKGLPPYNPDGTPDLSRITAENISLFELPEDQEKDLALLRETHPAPQVLESRISRRQALLIGIPSFLVAGAALRDPVVNIKNSSLDSAVASISGIEKPPKQYEANKETPPAEPTPTPERPVSGIEFDASNETPFRIDTKDSSVFIDDTQLQPYIDSFAGTGTEINISMINRDVQRDTKAANIHEDTVIRRKYANLIITSDGKINPSGDWVGRKMIINPEGEEVFGYEIPGLNLMQPYIEIVTLSGTKVIDPMQYPVTLTSPEEIDSRPTSTDSSVVRLVSEKPLVSGISGNSILEEAVTLNMFLKSGKIVCVGIHDIDRSAATKNHLPEYESSTNDSLVISLPYDLTQLEFPGTSIEQPALARMTYEGISQMCVPNETESSVRLRTALEDISKFIYEDAFHVRYDGQPMNDFGGLLDVKSDYYELPNDTFSDLDHGVGLSYNPRVIFLMNLTTILRHYPDKFEKKYDELERQDARDSIDKAVFLTLSALCSVSGKDKLGIFIPRVKDIIEKRLPAMKSLESGIIGNQLDLSSLINIIEQENSLPEE